MTPEELEEVEAMRRHHQQQALETLAAAYAYRDRMALRRAIVFGAILLILALFLCGVPSAIISAIWH